MFSPLLVIAVVCAYMGLLLVIALAAEKQVLKRGVLTNKPIFYALSIALFCTTWTYYGGVGLAATSGMQYVASFLGATLSVMLWWMLLRKMVRIKTVFRVTSIADFISTRYNRSQVVAGIVTIISFFAFMPYCALQFKAIFWSFGLITDASPHHPVNSGIEFFILGIIVLFTIVLGIRRLDPTERHEGMVAAVAIESVVKLGASLAAGIFVTFFLFNGFGDLFGRFSVSEHFSRLSMGGCDPHSLAQWNSSMLLAFFAVLFLPRQFHIAVVENSDERHIRTAMWMFPLYMLLINIFIFPIAIGGLLKGYALGDADRFSLLLPLHYGKPLLVLLVYLGGISAAAGMIMVSSVAISTMLTNHFVVPVIGWFKRLGFLQRHLLKCRWAAVALCITAGYLFNRVVSESFMLNNIGNISFSAVLQCAPAVLGGLFWRRGSKTGAILGLSSGFLVWFYTLLLPTYIRSISLDSAFLTDGPLGIGFLRPEQLFGILGVYPLAHTICWSLFFNIGSYVLGSLIFKSSDEEQNMADEFIGVMAGRPSLSMSYAGEEKIDVAPKTKLLQQLFGNYFAGPDVMPMVQKCVAAAGIGAKARISIVALAELQGAAEKLLTGAIGAASAHSALKACAFFTPQEAEKLSSAYGEILAGLKVDPAELKARIDYFQEREGLLQDHASQLEEKISELETQIIERKKAEEKIRYLSFHDKLTDLYNRAYLEEELKRLDTERQLPVSIIMGDANNLKLTNDAFGHAEGDKLLLKMVEYMRASCRKEDIIARWGGDEFIILLPRTDETAALEIVRHIRRFCKTDGASPMRPSIALGLATRTDMAMPVTDVLKEAEDRMYRNKLMDSKSGRNSIIASLLKTLRERSHETEQHTRRLRKMIVRIGRAIRLSESQMDELALLSVMHDVGKISIPDEILMKPSALTPKEWEIMKKHTEVGYRIALSFNALAHIANGILAHHERWDGKGYPQGLAGTDIPLISRILSVADAYDVMTHGRSYSRPISHGEALRELKNAAGTQFDPELVEVFIRELSMARHENHPTQHDLPHTPDLFTVPEE